MGRCIAENLAKNGVHLAIHYRTSQQEAASFTAQLHEQGAHACPLYADLSQETDCKQLIEQTLTALEGLDILILNAALFRHDELGSLSQEFMHQQLQINLVAPLLLTKTFYQAVPSGQVILLLDQRIAHATAHHWSYTLSKKALADATRMLAAEMAPHFRVNAIAPGPILLPDTTDTQTARESAGFIPLERRPTPNDVFHAITYLLHAQSTTGQIIYVDGGQHLGERP